MQMPGCVTAFTAAEQTHRGGILPFLFTSGFQYNSESSHLQESSAQVGVQVDVSVQITSSPKHTKIQKMLDNFMRTGSAIKAMSITQGWDLRELRVFGYQF